MDNRRTPTTSVQSRNLYVLAAVTSIGLIGTVLCYKSGALFGYFVSIFITGGLRLAAAFGRIRMDRKVGSDLVDAWVSNLRIHRLLLPALIACILTLLLLIFSIALALTLFRNVGSTSNIMLVFVFSCVAVLLMSVGALSVVIYACAGWGSDPAARLIDAFDPRVPGMLIEYVSARPALSALNRRALAKLWEYSNASDMGWASSLTDRQRKNLMRMARISDEENDVLLAVRILGSTVKSESRIFLEKIANGLPLKVRTPAIDAEIRDSLERLGNIPRA